MWDLPVSVEIDGKKYKITNQCDYRMVLDVICALSDVELDHNEKVRTALYVFYEDLTECNDLQKAVDEMMKIINVGAETDKEDSNKPQIMDWQHDFPQLAPPISRVLGYSVRDAKKYTHWYDFIGAYMEIGECTFSTIISIRKKKIKGKKLDDWEREFYKEHKKMIDLPRNLTEEDKDWLDSDW